MLPSRAWSQGRQISLPRAILSSPPDGGTSATSLLESSTHTPQTHPHPQPGSQMSFLLCLRSAKAPFRAFNLQIVFVRFTHHPCSTSEDVTAPTPHTPFARCHQGQCLRGDLPGAPLTAAVGAGAQRARAAGPWSASLALDCESSSATFPGGLGHMRFRFPAGEMGKEPCLTGLS